MTKKLTNQIVDERLQDRNLKRLDDYINNNEPIYWLCLICSYEWVAIPDNILNKGRGCPKCSGKIKLTNEDVDTRLIGRNIKRLDDYTGSLHPMNWCCMKCDYEWVTTPNSIFNNRSGCPNCYGNVKLDDEKVDLKLIGRNIKRVGNHINTHTPTSWQCLKCNHEWMTSSDNILNAETGCPKCADRIKLTNEIVDQRLKDRFIKRLDDYISKNIVIWWSCLKCFYEWKTTPGHILNGETGCPQCLKKNETLVGVILKREEVEFNSQELLKVIVPSSTNKNYTVDYYLPEQNIVIEYNGRQHYEPVCFGGISIKRAEANFDKQRSRDVFVQQICNDNNISLILIDGRKYTNSNLEKYLIEEIVPMLKSAKSAKSR